MIVDTVKIIHNELECGEYRFLADFFRLVGSHVCDCNLKNGSEAGENFDVVIVIRRKLGKQLIDGLKEKYPMAVFMDEMAGDNYLPADVLQYLGNCLDKILLNSVYDNKDILNKEIEELKYLVGIYANEELMRCRNIFSYFTENKDEVQKAQDRFVSANIQLRNGMKERGYKSKYLIYARIDLCRFINETCGLLSQRFLYDTKKCCKYLDNAFEEDPSFENAYLLQAFLSEIDSVCKYNAAGLYEEGLEHIASMSFASYPLYRYGRYFEKIIQDDRKAMKYYMRSYSINKQEYRAIYKQIRKNYEVKNYEAAIHDCDEICNILKEKEQENYLQPREYEYLFKAYLEKERSLLKSKGQCQEYRDAMENKIRICELVTSRSKKNRMYTQIFGEEAEHYLELTRIRLENVAARCTE